MERFDTTLYSLYKQFTMASPAELVPFKKKIIEHFRTISNPTSIDYHTLGVTHYDTAESDEDIIEAHQFFISALDYDRHYFMARLYSAHCFHDLKCYDMALHEYLLVDQNKLKSVFHIWRYIKLLEQIGHCHYKLNCQSEALHYFEKALSLYQQHYREDLADPYEVYDCLDEDNPIAVQFREVEEAYYNSLGSTK